MGKDLLMNLFIEGVERCKKELEAASIRSNFSIKPQCGVYYYEIQVNSKGTDGYIAIGLCTVSSALNHLPGKIVYLFEKKKKKRCCKLVLTF